MRNMIDVRLLDGVKSWPSHGLPSERHRNDVEIVVLSANQGCVNRRSSEVDSLVRRATDSLRPHSSAGRITS